MKAILKRTHDEYAPYKLLLKAETKEEQRLLQSWYNSNPLGESFCTELGWVRLRAIGVDVPKQLHSDYLPELTAPQRVEAVAIRRVLKEKEEAALHYARRFDRAVKESKDRVREWVEDFKEKRKQRKKKKRK